MLKLKEWIAKVSSSLRLVSTSTSSNLAYHNGKAYFWRQGSIVYFSINGSFTNLPNGGYTTLGTITQGFRPTNPTVFHRQEAGPHNGTNVGLLLKLTNTGEISIYNYTGAVYSGNGYFNGCYACSENLNGVVPASSIPAGVADYVVEQGASGIWKYRKWNSGIAECWGTFYKTVSIAASGHISAGVGAFLDIFIDRPVTTVSGGGTANPSIFVTYTNAYSTSTGYGLDAYWRNLSGSAFNNQAWMDIHAIGRWK